MFLPPKYQVIFRRLAVAWPELLAAASEAQRFNRFRKLLMRYEKLERSFKALNHLAAAIIAFRKVPLAVDIIYG